MRADLDTLLTAIYVLLDDFLPERSGPGRPPKITDAELICLAIAQVFLGVPNDRQFLGLRDLAAGAPLPLPAEAARLQQAAALALNALPIALPAMSMPLSVIAEIRENRIPKPTITTASGPDKLQLLVVAVAGSVPRFPSRCFGGMSSQQDIPRN